MNASMVALGDGWVCDPLVWIYSGLKLSAADDSPITIFFYLPFTDTFFPLILYRKIESKKGIASKKKKKVFKNFK